MLKAITHKVSPKIVNCELTYLDRAPIDYARAVKQQAAYCNYLAGCGVAVIELSENLDYPDCCFVEDTAIVLDEIAIIANPGALSRRPEVGLVKRELAKYREIAQLNLPDTLDGGDVLRIGKQLFIGNSLRTNLSAIAEVGRLLAPFGYRVEAAPLNGCLHLKSACAAIDEQTVLINPQWIDAGLFKNYRVLTVDAEEPWAANILRVGDSICHPRGFEKTQAMLQKHYRKIDTLDISELQKAEAALTCLSIIFS
jgi:dimethylargininase